MVSSTMREEDNKVHNYELIETHLVRSIKLKSEKRNFMIKAKRKEKESAMQKCHPSNKNHSYMNMVTMNGFMVYKVYHFMLKLISSYTHQTQKITITSGK